MIKFIEKLNTMKKLFTFLLIIIPILSYSQEQKINVKVKKEKSFGEQLLHILLLKVFSRKISPTLLLLNYQI